MPTARFSGSVTHDRNQRNRLAWGGERYLRVAGSAVSLAYMPRGGHREAALRFAAGALRGPVFGNTGALKIATQLGIAGTIGGF